MQPADTMWERRYAVETDVTDISDIYRRNTDRIIDCVGDGLCPCKSCEIIAVVQMFRI